MKIGVDLDGTLTSVGLYNTDTKLPWWCALWLIFVWPNKIMIKILQRLKKRGDEIIIISARPKQLENLTQYWCKKHKIPIDRIICIGTGEKVEERKLEIIRKENIKMFIDDDSKIVSYLKEKGIDAYFPSK